MTPSSAAALVCSSRRVIAISVRSIGEVEAAGLAVGDEAVGDGDAGPGELRDDSSSSEVDVVGMGGDDKGALDLIWL